MALGLQAPAFAQQGAEGALEEIVVTAQKRVERLIDVPVAVTAVDSQALVEQNLVSFADYYTRVPGLQFTGGGTEQLGLRGITAGGSGNPTVAILIDDVQFGSSTYLGRPPLPDLDPAMLERIEALRGPQGTLYGASSLGGLIKFVTKDPSTTEFSARVESGANVAADGSDGWSTRGAINIPIMEDKIGLSLSGFYRDDPTWIDNIVGAQRPPTGGVPVTGGTRVEDTNENTVWGGRAGLLVNLTDKFAMRLSALYQEKEDSGGGQIAICSTCSVSSNTPLTYDPRFTNTDLRTAIAAIAEPATTTFEMYTGRFDLNLDAVQLTSISAWSKSDVQETSDATATFGPPLLENPAFGPIYSPPGGIIFFGQPITTDKFSEEFRLAGSANAFDWLGGIYYTKEDTLLAQTLDRVAAGGFNGRVYNGLNESDYEEKAVFADVTLHITDQFDVQVGARYAENEQSYRVRSIIEEGAQLLFGPGEDSLFKFDDSALTWVVAPTYHLNPDLMTYVRVATGYRPGGPNTESPGAAPTFAPDTVTNYELGLKGTVLEGRFNFDVAAFQIDWDDIQLQNTALPSSFLFFENGETARSRGLELAGGFRIGEGLHIGGNAIFLDAELTETLQPSVPPTATDGGVQRLRGEDGDRLPASAKFSGNINVRQDFDLTATLSGYAGFNVSYVGERFGTFNQNTDGLPGRQVVMPRVKVPSYTVVDLQAGVNLGEMWTFNVYAKNVFDEDGFISIGTASGTNLPQATLIQPRTIGVGLSVDF